MMPQLGETVTEGTITRWMKAVGDAVERDEPLFEVSTDKVDSEVPSPAAGVLSEILVPEGETVEVGVKLAVIGDGAAAAPSEAAPAAVAPEPSPPAAPAQAAPTPAPPAAAPAPAPAATEPAVSPAPTAESNGDGVGPSVLSPMVRKLLAENGISESEVTGTGSGGRITRDDAQREVEARRAATPPPPAGPSSSRSRSRSRSRNSAATASCRPERAGHSSGAGSAGAPCVHGLLPGCGGPDRALLQHATPDG